MREAMALLAERIRKNNKFLSAKAGELRDTNPGLVREVASVPLDLSVSGVDGGAFFHRVHGADVAAIRAVGVSFFYRNSKLGSFSHYPSRKPEPALQYREGLDEHEASVFRSLARLRQELLCSREMIEKFSPDVLLFDGSLLPLPSDKPPEGSGLCSLYQEVVSLYDSVFSACRDTLLCGVIKDSRARKLGAEFSLDCSDTMLCEHLLKAGERTAEFPCSCSGPGSRVNTFYLRPSEQDLPLRVETISSVEKAAEAVLSLSSISSRFAYPAVLTEADMCAAFDRQDIAIFQKDLFSLAGFSSLRRSSRPFR
ncbi:hypothetical protein GF318_01530 [Candidatus Micrarchaeota archaeon]|nr:hypothetical protein [Candidatus Micrarchaeota archaeon]